MTSASLTLGVPVYNGVAAGLERLVRSLLEDEFGAIEVIISDNGSTDGTWDLINELNRSDERLSVHRFSENRGVVANFNRVLELAGTPFFKWCAVGDVVRPGLLRAGVDALKSHPHVALAHCRYDFTDGQRTFSTTNDDRRFFDPAIIAATASEFAARRVKGAIDHHGYGGQLFGLMRTEMVQRLGGHPDRSEGDRILLGRLAAQGPWKWDNRVLWSSYVPPVPVPMSDYRFRTDVEGSIDRHVMVGGGLGLLSFPQRAPVTALLGARILGRKFRDCGSKRHNGIAP